MAVSPTFTERLVGALADAQALVRGLGGVSDKEGGPVGDEVEQWTKRLPLRPASPAGGEHAAGVSV